MLKRIVLFTFLLSIIATPSFSLFQFEGGAYVPVEQDNCPIVISSFTHEVNELMGYNGPWMTTTITLLIETAPSDSLASLAQSINFFNYFEKTEIDWTMLLEQNPELLFQIVNENDYLQPGTMLLLTANTPIWRLHSGGSGLTHTM
jgi:hypothetical protein